MANRSAAGRSTVVSYEQRAGEPGARRGIEAPHGDLIDDDPDHHRRRR